jgi:hypothetical protein
MFVKKNLTKYLSIGMSIMLLSSVLLTTQTFDFGKDAHATDTNAQNDDIVHIQSPSHFRYGHINWHRIGMTNEVEFNVLNQFTRSDYIICVNPITQLPTPCTGPGGSPGVGDVFTETVAFPDGTELFFGDTTNSGALEYLVDSINVAQDTLFAHAVNLSRSDQKIRHTYSGTGPFLAEINDSTRNVVEENNPNKGYRVSTIIDLSISNQSPVSTLAPVIVCPAGICKFTIPATDADGDTLNFRLSTAAEAGDAGFVQPGAGTPQPLTVVSTNGTVTWNTSGFQNPPSCIVSFDPLCLYSTSITIEEKRGSTVIGKVMVDFLINIDAPTLSVTPPPSNGGKYNMIVGVTLQLLVACLDPNAADTVTIGSSALPADATLSPSIPGNPASRIFTFSPIVVQNVSVTFTCVDNKGNQAAPLTININVTPAPPRIVKTVHAEKHNFTTVIDGIPFIVDITIVGEVYEDLNTQLIMNAQALVVTCLKLPNQGILHECSATVPPADVVPVSDCMEVPFNGIHTMNTIVKGSNIISISQDMNTVAKGFLVKTIKADKEVFECTFDNIDETDDVRVDLVVFTEIFENLSKIEQTPPPDTIIRTNFLSFRCVTLLETLEVQSCLFEQLFD